VTGIRASAGFRRGRRNAADAFRRVFPPGLGLLLRLDTTADGSHFGPKKKQQFTAGTEKSQGNRRGTEAACDCHVRMLNF
jgi:hypothetical protein